MATFTVNRIAVEVSGEGDQVVCIHGLGGSSNVWSPILDAFQGLRVVRPDLPGSGSSALPAEALSIDVYVKAIETVVSHLGIQKTHIVAHSMGTIVAMHLAVRRPELVRSLALFGPLVAPPEPARPNIKARAAKAREGLQAMHEIADILVGGAISKKSRVENRLGAALVRESVMHQSPEAYAQSCEALAGAQSAEIENIGAPTLLITGDEDGVAPVANVEKIATRIKGSQMKVYASCGHWQTFEYPELCEADLRTFYASVA